MKRRNKTETLDLTKKPYELETKEHIYKTNEAKFSNEFVQKAIIEKAAREGINILEPFDMSFSSYSRPISWTIISHDEDRYVTVSWKSPIDVKAGTQ